MSHYQQFVPPFPIPDSWEWCKLSDCCHIAGRIGFRGYTKEDLVSECNGAITLSPSNIVNDSMQYDTCTYISWEKYYESPEIQVQNNDILLVKTGSSFGKCALVKDLPQEATINPQFVVLKRIMFSSEYLTILLQSPYARKCYEKFVLGTAIPTFTQEKLGNLAIPMPPYCEQLRIIQKFQEIQSGIDSIILNKQELASCIKLAKSKILDLAMQGKLVPQNPNDEPAADMLRRINPKAKIITDNPHLRNIPKNWCITDLKSIGKWQAGATPSKMNSDFYGIGYPWLNTGDLTDDYIYTIPKQITELALKETSVKLNPKGSVLIAMYGATIGKLGILTFPATTNQACCACAECYINNKFLFYFLKYYRPQFLKMGGGGAQSNISKEKIKKTILLLPPNNEQKRIVNKIEELYSIFDDIEASLQS